VRMCPCPAAGSRITSIYAISRTDTLQKRRSCLSIAPRLSTAQKLSDGTKLMRGQLPSAAN